MLAAVHAPGLLRLHPPLLLRLHPSLLRLRPVLLRLHPSSLLRLHPSLLLRRHPSLLRLHPSLLLRLQALSTHRLGAPRVADAEERALYRMLHRQLFLRHLSLCSLLRQLCFVRPQPRRLPPLVVLPHLRLLVMGPAAALRHRLRHPPLRPLSRLLQDLQHQLPHLLRRFCAMSRLVISLSHLLALLQSCLPPSCQGSPRTRTPPYTL